MTYALLTLRFEPRLALVQLNRPGARNALSQARTRELIALASTSADSRAARAAALSPRDRAPGGPAPSLAGGVCCRPLGVAQRGLAKTLGGAPAWRFDEQVVEHAAGVVDRPGLAGVLGAPLRLDLRPAQVVRHLEGIGAQ